MNYQKKFKIILLHGAYYKEWCWKRVKKYLKDKGFEKVKGVSYPYYSEKTVAEITFETFVESVEKELKDCDNPIIVAHSMSGAVLTELCNRYPSLIKGAIFLSAFIPLDGESVFDIVDKRPKDRDHGAVLEFNSIQCKGGEFEMVGLDEAYIIERFLDDCLDFDKTRFSSKMAQNMPRKPMETKVYRKKGFYKVNKFYIECLKDRAISLMEQRQMYKGVIPIEKVKKLNASHSPFFSMPTDLGDTIISIVEEIEQSQQKKQFLEIITSYLQRN